MSQGPKGGTLSADLQYPRCHDCKRNRNGLFTRRTTSGEDWECLKCGTTWARSASR